MRKVVFDGETYHDDRMFVLHVCPCTVVAIDDDVLETTIYHEEPPRTHKWCLVTYRNVARFPAIRVDHFDSIEAAQEYMRDVEPTVPLISLDGGSPMPPLPYDQFAKWKAENRFTECDYKKMYSEGGTKPREIVLSRKR
jgi:hypothetical protein